MRAFLNLSVGLKLLTASLLALTMLGGVVGTVALTGRDLSDTVARQERLGHAAALLTEAISTAAATPASVQTMLTANRPEEVEAARDAALATLDATATIDGATLARAPEDMLVVKLARSGTRSTYGDLRLTLDGQSQPVYVVRGIAIYTPNSDRDVLLPLPAEVRQKIAGRALRIDYVSTDTKAPGLIASRSVTL